jgi:hypothetical protein
MARIRSIHPTQWTDEDFVSCSSWARLLAIGLRNEADDAGVFEWKPLGLKMRLMPADNVDVEALLAELVEHQQVLCFRHGGRLYGAIRNFCRFQRPKKPDQKYPLPRSIATYTAAADDGLRSAFEVVDDEPGGGPVGSGSGSNTVQFPTGSPPVRNLARRGRREEEREREEEDSYPSSLESETPRASEDGAIAPRQQRQPRASPGGVSAETIDALMPTYETRNSRRGVERLVELLVAQTKDPAPVELHLQRAISWSLDDPIGYAQKKVLDRFAAVESAKHIAENGKPNALEEGMRMYHETLDHMDPSNDVTSSSSGLPAKAIH